MVRTSEALEVIETVTLGHYDQNADSFWEATKDHEEGQNYKEFLAPFPEGKTLDILDFGCEPRESCPIFLQPRPPSSALGYGQPACSAIWLAGTLTAKALDSKSFLSLRLPHQAFDSVFAN